MGVQVADRRRWQSAVTSPIGDVGSERVKAKNTFLDSVAEGGIVFHKHTLIFIMLPEWNSGASSFCPVCDCL